jgi:DNA processing protein
MLVRSAGDESGRPSSASLFPDQGLPPHEKRIPGLLKADQATHIEEIVEQLETEMSPSEIFVALFQVESAGECEADVGEEFCKKTFVLYTNKLTQSRKRRCAD